MTQLQDPLKAKTLQELQDAPTISSSHTANLKYDDGEYRIWLSRTGKADGERYDNEVTVERLESGGWITVKTYRARSGRW